MPTQPLRVRFTSLVSNRAALAALACPAVINFSSSIRLATTSRRSRAALMLVIGLLACGFWTSPASMADSARFSSEAFLL